MATAAAPCDQPGRQPCFGCIQAAEAASPTSGYCGCRVHYVPGQGLVVAYRCAYHGGYQEGGAEEWQWYDDPYEHHVGFDVGEYQPDFEYHNWDVEDSNEKTRKELERRKAAMATKEAYAVDGGWAYRWMLTSERSIIPAYVVLVTLIVCMLIAIAVVNTLPGIIEEGASTPSIAGVPFLTRPRVRAADAAVLTTIDNTSYTTDNY